MNLLGVLHFCSFYYFCVDFILESVRYYCRMCPTGVKVSKHFIFFLSPFSFFCGSLTQRVRQTDRFHFLAHCFWLAIMVRSTINELAN